MSARWLLLAALVPAKALASVPVPATIPPVPAPAAGAVSAVTATPCVPDAMPPGDWPSLCHYRDANRTIDVPPRAVMIGDSITEFWLPASPALFSEGIVDRGVHGQTSTQIVARFYQDVVRLRPHVVHILCGINDIAGNTGFASPDAYANAILAMVDMARANGIAVVVGSILPAGSFSWRPGYHPAAQVVAFNAWLRDLTQRRGLMYADYYSAMAAPDGSMKPGLSIDGVHPNAAGYAIMEPIARAAIGEAERHMPKP